MKGLDFFLIGVDTLDMDLPPFPTALLSKLPPMDIHNALFTIMLLHEVMLLLLNKEFISQQMKCGDGPMLKESIGLFHTLQHPETIDLTGF